ncbi:MAG: hypothetical protein AUI36_03210, partial [Cyanobacteria bacterium 13_1_40CM_2_61_4]
PLGREATKYQYVDLFQFSPPPGRDGFLATNALLTFALLLSRAYASLNETGSPPPRSLKALVHPGRSANEYATTLRRACQPLWDRDNLLLLYGNTTQAAAVDLESKFSEAALGTVQLTDYRNFAHGRHNWLAKRGGSTAVLALVSEEDRDVAERTLRLLPKSTPLVRIWIPLPEELAGISALVAVLHIAGLAGSARGIDPGRPGVPPFGRKIYNLRVWKTSSNAWAPFPSRKVAAIERKTGVAISGLEGEELSYWARAYEEFIRKIQSPRFGAVVFDYDGTLCDRRDRFIGIRHQGRTWLNQLLSAGIAIGIATGRGKSVKETLREAVDRRFWPSLLVGYYNGGDIGILSDDSHPDASNTAPPELKAIAEALNRNPLLRGLADVDLRFAQLTVTPKLISHWDQVWKMVQHTLHSLALVGVRVLRSSHSVDVLALGVSKLRLFGEVEKLATQGRGGPVLCIGDLGCWPGNDFDLLSTQYSLSVDEVSPDPTTCWNLAPPGHRGVQACLDYLRAMKIQGSSVKLKVSDIHLGNSK